MMKALDIAIKDMKQAFRSLFALAFMFLIPILVTSLFSLMFKSDEGEVEPTFQLSIIPVELVNQDQGMMGGILADALGSEGLSDLLSVTTAEDDVAARQAVDQQLAQVAIIIPADFTSALMSQGSQTQVELYQDPAQTIGPGIVETIVNQFMVSFSGSKIMLDVAGAQLAENGFSLTAEQTQNLISEYTQAVQTMGGEQNMIQSQTPTGESRSTTGGVVSMLGMIMGGMMIFYAFFTGTYTSNTILKEEEEGTLARLFSTATPRGTILIGKLLAAAMMISVQISVLLLFGWLVFNLQWGSLLMLVPVIVVTTFGAATFGLFAISLAKDRKQAGVINGAGVTVTGMLGMADIFMMSSPNPSQAISSLTLFVPQGWANQALIAIFNAQPSGEVLMYLGGLVVWSAVLFWFGFRRFQKRFA
ncbi:MAG: ABC transporter permease [Anaerolineales bacterium]